MTKIPEAEIGQYYGELLEDIKARLHAVRKMLSEIGSGEASDREAYAYRYFKAEFCYLQIRRVTELLALALVVAHNSRDDVRSNVFVDGWQADKIFGALHKLGNGALPKPARTGVSPMSFNDLRHIYQQCSDKLHTVSLKAYLARGNKRYDAPQILKWVTQISSLLDPHTLELHGRLLAACLNDELGNVQCKYIYPPSV